MLASVIVNACRVTLIDAAAATWSDAELLGYLNEAERAVVFLKPDAYTVRDYIPMVAGTNQAIPTGGVAVLDLSQNEVSKRRVTLVDKELLDEANRFWQAATEETDVQHWCADPRDPTRFDITPPNDGTGSVLCLYGAVPTAIAATSNAINLNDSYQYALECFTLSRAYAKNSRKQDLAKSAAYMNEFRQSLGIKATAQIAVAPKVSSNVGD